MNRLTSFALAALACVLLFFTIFGNHGLLHLYQITNELHQLEQKNRLIESDIVSLQNQIFGVASSEETLERLAREELGLSKPDEIVYIFPESQTAAGKTATNKTVTNESGQ